MKKKSIQKLTCHCGAIELELNLPNGLENIRRCNCSMCSKRCAIAASIDLAGLKVVKGEEQITLYQFNTKTARHYFCSICGIYTHHQRRSSPTQYGFNVACLEGIDPFQFDNIHVVDGINHPADILK